MVAVIAESLIAVIRLQDGTELRIPLSELGDFELPEGAEIMVLDERSGLVPEGLVVRQDGADAVIEIDGEEKGRLKAFHDTAGTVFYPEGWLSDEAVAEALEELRDAPPATGDEEAGAAAMENGSGGLSTPLILGGIALGGAGIALAASSSSSSGSSSRRTLIRQPGPCAGTGLHDGGPLHPGLG